MIDRYIYEKSGLYSFYGESLINKNGCGQGQSKKLKKSIVCANRCGYV
ncbi:hypothetical protein [Clostridium tetani]|nr:hypothetical protein [Clostridium tetani]